MPWAAIKFGMHFLLTEWEQVVNTWQLQSWEAYRDAVRLGRKTRLPEAQRRVLWSIFDRVRAGLKSRQLITHAELFSSLAAGIPKNKNVVFDFAIVNEAQDITVAHLRFFTALGGERPNALFFAGDPVSASSSSPSPGRLSAWTSGGVRAPCA
ncbi:MAG: hypothetical protein M3Z35_17890 [Nitrospirota bacterium]|nr:hypothetical protein [Nitrospirota bacterium]